MKPRSPFEYDPFKPDFQARSHEVYRRLRDEHPVYHNEARNFWAISRFEDVWAATLNLESLTTEGMEEAKALKPMLNFLDPPRHDQLRALVSRAFTFRRVQEMEPKIRRIARELISDFFDRGECDFLEDYAIPLPGRIIAEMIGVPEERRKEFLGYTRAIALGDQSKSLTETIRDPAAKIYNEFGLLIEERLKSRQDDLMSALIDAEIDGERLTRDEIEGFCFQLIIAGNDTTTTLIGNGAVLLEQHPDQRALLVREPERIPKAVEEMLRYEPPAQALPRRARQELTLHGQTIPEDARVLLVWAAANLDEREFAAPERFNVERNIKRHLALGHGTHFCLGASLARLEARVAFEELLARIPEYNLTREPEWVTSRWLRGHEEIPISFSGTSQKRV
ncbi:MAG: cytochrome P450 [Myxococcota bacterium]